jgi:hypothetical protein
VGFTLHDPRGSRCRKSINFANFDDIYLVSFLQGAAKIQETFSAEYYPTIWRILPAYEELLAEWRVFSHDPRMIALWPAIEAGIESLEKYYNKTDNSPAHIISTCE